MQVELIGMLNDIRNKNISKHTFRYVQTDDSRTIDDFIYYIKSLNFDINIIGQEKSHALLPTTILTFELYCTEEDKDFLKQKYNEELTAIITFDNKYLGAWDLNMEAHFDPPEIRNSPSPYVPNYGMTRDQLNPGEMYWRSSEDRYFSVGSISAESFQINNDGDVQINGSNLTVSRVDSDLITNEPYGIEFNENHGVDWENIIQTVSNRIDEANRNNATYTLESFRNALDNDRIRLN